MATVHTLDQRYILCADYDRDMVLIAALRKYREENETANVMIFTNTKKYVFIWISKNNSSKCPYQCLLRSVYFFQMLSTAIDDFKCHRN